MVRAPGSQFKNNGVIDHFIEVTGQARIDEFDTEILRCPIGLVNVAKYMCSRFYFLNLL